MDQRRHWPENGPLNERMLFNTVAFFVFFLVVAAAYFAVPHRFRWALLLAASYYFYMCWKVEYALLIVISTVVDYFAALRMARTNDPRARKLFLVASLCVNLGLLVAFKYFDFVAGTVRTVAEGFSISLDIPSLGVLLPVGISFYTFQTLAYTIDVYRGQCPPERHFGRFALYVSFFPQLVAGPIERASRLLPQFRVPQRFDYVRVCDGLQLIGWGLFKKIVIADRLGMYVDAVYHNVPEHNGPSYVIATYFFAFQIYCDFSGYSDIAVGSARVLGIDLMQNFRRPYFATTIRDFWRRWHISLSTWLRDYLYRALGGNRAGTLRTYVNLMITMLLGGLWHGANWTFVVWGALQGVMLCASRWSLPWRDTLVTRLRIPQTIVNATRMFITFHLICFSWVFFRSTTLADACHIVSNLHTGWPRPFLDFASMSHGAIGIILLLIVQTVQTRVQIRAALSRSPLVFRWAVFYALIFAIVLFAVDTGSQFIYFQF